MHRNQITQLLDDDYLYAAAALARYKVSGSDAYGYIVRSQGQREDATTNTIDSRNRVYGLGIGFPRPLRELSTDNLVWNELMANQPDKQRSLSEESTGTSRIIIGILLAIIAAVFSKPHGSGWDNMFPATLMFFAVALFSWGLITKLRARRISPHDSAKSPQENNKQS